MDFTFERGSADNPRGHALIYFQSFHDAGELLATYLVVLPIQVDVSKYVPPVSHEPDRRDGRERVVRVRFPTRS